MVNIQGVCILYMYVCLYMRKYVKAGWKMKVATQHSNEIKKFVRLHLAKQLQLQCNGRDG